MKGPPLYYIFDEGGGYDDNAGYPGNDIDNKITNGGADECAKWCDEKKECKFWTFYKTTKACWQKSKKSSRTVDTNAISCPAGNLSYAMHPI